MQGKKLYRTTVTDKKIAGVCGGIARYFNIDPTVVRVLALITLLLGSLGFWVYIIMWIFVPTEEEYLQQSGQQPPYGPGPDPNMNGQYQQYNGQFDGTYEQTNQNNR